MLKRLVIAAAVVLGVLAAPAAAQQYPPQDNKITVSDFRVTRGQTVEITAQFCPPGSEVTFTFHSDPVVLGTATADPDGVATLSATIPEDASFGRHDITAECGDLLLRTFVVVVPEAGAGTRVSSAGGLADTGSDSLPLARIGLGLAAAGGVLTAIAAKRRKHAAAGA